MRDEFEKVIESAGRMDKSESRDDHQVPDAMSIAHVEHETAALKAIGTKAASSCIVL